MIFKNDLFVMDGTNYRLLETDVEKDRAWVIDINDRLAQPLGVVWSTISGLQAQEPQTNSLTEARATSAALKARDRAKNVLWPLLGKMRELYDESARSRVLRQHAKATGASLPSLYKWLRMYWQGGQCESALLPAYSRCGRTEGSVTAGRGARPENGTETYQLKQADVDLFEAVLKKHYLDDERILLSKAYDFLLRNHYNFIDGNGQLYLRGPGSRPSLRQFRYYLKTHYSLEEQLRRRKGDKVFELEHRPVLGTVNQDCLGVGDIFECDATIADVFLVAMDDVQSIVGKATIYLIVDRFSRLITGVYVGLENPSWVCAKQALLFISQDKQKLCNEYGLEYDPADWPAHTVFPGKVLADLGEWNTKAGEQFGNRLTTKVLYVPSKRGEWKPVVESDFKQVRTTLQDGTPGMDPPENAKRRQGKHYEKDACLNLHEFTRVILALVIKHNRTPVADYELSMADLREGFVPTPIAIWNRDIARRSGVLTRYTEEHVRQQLLPSGSASVTEHGIEFKGCLYTCDHALARGWFTQARKKRFSVEVRYDHRLVNNIYLVDPSGSGGLILCQLSTRTEVHRGRSFAEVEVYKWLRKKLEPEVTQTRLQATADYHATVDPTNKQAKAALTGAKVKKTRSARRADTKEARARDLSAERQKTASLVTPLPKEAPSAEVLDMAQFKASKPTVPETTSSQSQPGKQAPLSIAERTKLARERLKEIA